MDHENRMEVGLGINTEKRDKDRLVKKRRKEKDGDLDEEIEKEAIERRGEKCNLSMGMKQ
jgi:hypothetical protein